MRKEKQQELFYELDTINGLINKLVNSELDAEGGEHPIDRDLAIILLTRMQRRLMKKLN